MKNSPPTACLLVSILALAILVPGFAGCATTKQVDWNSRVGNYTYDQAVVDMGPPDKEARTSDGQTVAEWITSRAGGGSISIGTGFYGRRSGMVVGQSVGSGHQVRATRLTFGADGRLISWLKS